MLNAAAQSEIIEMDSRLRLLQSHSCYEAEMKREQERGEDKL